MKCYNKFCELNIIVSITARKMSLPSVVLKPIDSLLNKQFLRKIASPEIQNLTPLTFEALNQYSGLVLYEALLPTNLKSDPMKLTVEKVHDLGYVFVDTVRWEAKLLLLLADLRQVNITLLQRIPKNNGGNTPIIFRTSSAHSPDRILSAVFRSLKV